MSAIPVYRERRGTDCRIERADTGGGTVRCIESIGADGYGPDGFSTHPGRTEEGSVREQG